MTEAVIQNNKKLYSTGQAFVAILLGGIFAAGIIYHNNLSYFSNNKHYKYIHFTIAFLWVCLTYAVAKHSIDIPKFATPVIVAGVSGIYYMLKEKNVSKEILRSNKRSWFMAIGVGLFAMVITIVITIATILLMEAQGIINFNYYQ